MTVGLWAGALAFVVALGWMPASAQAHSPPHLIVIGKVINFRQNEGGDLAKLNYYFFAQIFLLPGTTGGGTLIDPRGQATQFQPVDGALSIRSRTDFVSLADLEAERPDGAYQVEYRGEGQKPINGELNLQATASALADPVHIALLQDGRPVGAAGVAVDRDLSITWSAFAKGRADPNGISDDLIFVQLGDCQGRFITGTSAPFSDQPALTFRAKSFGVPANTLRPGATYQVSVEHARLSTRRIAGVPALVSHPAMTFLDFNTAGTRSGCPQVPVRMDDGQSDRPPAAPANSP